MISKLLNRWPLIQQLRNGTDGTGPESMSDRTRNLRPKTDGAEVARSICPYCGVGCGQLVYHKAGKLISIEGDPQSPISRGHLCPKGADTFELHTHPGRLKTVKYRAPYSREWQEIPLEQAMDMVADRVWETRERTFQESRNGRFRGRSEPEPQGIRCHCPRRSSPISPKLIDSVNADTQWQVAFPALPDIRGAASQTRQARRMRRRRWGQARQ